jgi:hypothetical protein
MLSDMQEDTMALWFELLRCLLALRPACTRGRTFAWMTLVIAGFVARPDLAGVTSFVRAGWLKGEVYRRLLALFHSPALRLPDLTQAWVRLVLTLFRPVTVGDYLVCLADGWKVPKEGKKMPAVKSLHVESANNSKPAFIMGHSFQAVSLLVHAGRSGVASVPLAARIHEGIVWCNANRRTLLDKLAALVGEIATAVDRRPLLLVADAYYASGKLIAPLRAAGHHLVTRVRINAVAYRQAARPRRPRRGRPRIYGPKVHLRRLLRDSALFISAPSPVYGEEDVVLQYRCLDLLWKPAHGLIRFVLVKHPTRGNVILMTTHLELEPLQVIALYGDRFKIEVGFKQAKYTLGAQAYHFWMADMKPIRKRQGDQYLHHKPELYRRHVQRKIDAYHRYASLACVAHGLLLHLAINFPDAVWKSFRSWMRTMDTTAVPSEHVVAEALRAELPEYLVRAPHADLLRKMIVENLDPELAPQWIKPDRLVACENPALSSKAWGMAERRGAGLAAPGSGECTPRGSAVKREVALAL